MLKEYRQGISSSSPSSSSFSSSNNNLPWAARRPISATPWPLAPNPDSAASLHSLHPAVANQMG